MKNIWKPTPPVAIFMVAMLTLGIALASCVKDGKQTVATDNTNFHVVLLFEVDGCKVYRFSDGGSIHYFTTCQGSVNHVDKHGEHRIDTTVEVDTTEKMH